jgi:hypothetical protein
MHRSKIRASVIHVPQCIEQTNRNTGAENHFMYGTGNDDPAPTPEWSYNNVYYADGLSDSRYGSFVKIRTEKDFRIVGISAKTGLGLCDVTESAQGVIGDCVYTDIRQVYDAPGVPAEGQGDKAVFSQNKDAVVGFGTNKLTFRASTADEPQGQIKVYICGTGTHGIGGRDIVEFSSVTGETMEEVYSIDGVGPGGGRARIVNRHLEYTEVGDGETRNAVLAKHNAVGSRVYVDSWTGTTGPTFVAGDIARDNLVFVETSKCDSFSLDTAVTNNGRGRCNEVIPTDIERPYRTETANVDLNAYAVNGFYVPEIVGSADNDIANGAQVVTGGKTYTLSRSVANGGTWTAGGAANLVLIEVKSASNLTAHIPDTLENLDNAIKEDVATKGVKYSTATTANVDALGYASAFYFGLAANVRGSGGNALTLTTTISNAVVDGATYAEGGTNDRTGLVGIAMDATGGARTITLPETVPAGWSMWFMKKDATVNTVTINNYLGVPQYVLATQGDEVRVSNDL